MTRWLIAIALLATTAIGCGVYSPYGAQTSGASTFSVQDFEPAHPLVSTSTAQALSEASAIACSVKAPCDWWKKVS